MDNFFYPYSAPRYFPYDEILATSELSEGDGPTSTRPSDPTASERAVPTDPTIPREIGDAMQYWGSSFGEPDPVETRRVPQMSRATQLTGAVVTDGVPTPGTPSGPIRHTRGGDARHNPYLQPQRVTPEAPIPPQVLRPQNMATVPNFRPRNGGMEGTRSGTDEASCDSRR